MKRTTIHTFLAALVGAGAVLAATPSHAALYYEGFDNASGTNQSVTTVDWLAYRGSTATDISTPFGTDNGPTIGQSGVSGANGNPSPPAGYLFSTVGTSVTNQTFSMVHTFSSGLTLTDGSNISWTMGNTDTNAIVRVLVQIGGDGSVGSGSWYASTELFTDGGGYSAATFAAAPIASVTYDLDFTTTAANWRSFTLDPDNTMSIGAVLGSDLSSNVVTGVGFFVSPGFSSQTVRLDNFTVVPEPASILVLGLCGTGLLVMRRGAAARRMA